MTTSTETNNKETSESFNDQLAQGVHDGLKTISKNIDEAADSLEKKEPTAWEQTKSGVSDAVDAVTHSVQEGWKSITSDETAAEDDIKVESSNNETSESFNDQLAQGVHDGLKTISKEIDAAADSLEKKEPTAWEQTKTSVSDAVDSVTHSVQEGWNSITASNNTDEIEVDSEKK